MKKGGGKRKGNAHEWLIAKQLGLWYYNDKNVFVRTPSSGAVATFRGDFFMPCGDLMQVKCLDDPFPFYIECKHLKDIELMDLLTGAKSSKLVAAWKQTLREKQEGKIPLLIYTPNRKPTICVSDPIGTDLLGTTRTLYAAFHNCYVFLLKEVLDKQPQEIRERAWQREKKIPSI